MSHPYGPSQPEGIYKRLRDDVANGKPLSAAFDEFQAHGYQSDEERKRLERIIRESRGDPWLLADRVDVLTQKLQNLDQRLKTLEKRMTRPQNTGASQPTTLDRRDPDVPRPAVSEPDPASPRFRS